MDIQEALNALAPTVADEEEIANITAKLKSQERAADHVTLPCLLSDWANCAADVNNPSWTVDDYTNDLCGRDLLDVAENLASDGLRSRLRTLLAEADREFLEGTVEDKEARLSNYFRVGTGWWWNRVPRDSEW